MCARWISEGWFAWEPDGWPYWSHHHHLNVVGGRESPNILFVHYSDLLADTEAEMRRIAAFLEIEINDATMPQLLAGVGIDSMRREVADSPVLPQIFRGGAAAFVFKGTNGRWRQTLLDDDLAMYESAAASLDPLQKMARARHRRDNLVTPCRPAQSPRRARICSRRMSAWPACCATAQHL